jgi:predicted nuclease of predicted toxin-antitoxin system
LIPLLLDQGLPRSAVGLLRGAGWDVEHVGECGLSEASDTEILAYARQIGYTICTLDADFHALLALSGESSPSVIRIRQEGLRATELAALLLSNWPRIERAVTIGAVVSITERDLRFRYLPIGRTGLA